jgi:hypothetical protein
LIIGGGAPAPIQSGAAGNAPAAPQTRVTKGQTAAQVLAILGPPVSVTTGAKHVYLYPHLKIVFVDGRVSEIQHL